MRADRYPPGSRRTVLAATLVGIAVLLPTLAWYFAGSREAAGRARGLEETALAAVTRAVASTADRLGHRLDALREAASGTDNTMPRILEAARAYATLGEICDALRSVFGE